MQTEFSQHPNTFNAYIKHGWKLTPIQPKSKKPSLDAWNEEGNHIKHPSDILPGYGCGILHAFSGTMALDIDHYEASKDILGQAGIDLDALLTAPDAVTIESGKPNRAKLLYAMPHKVIRPSKKIAHHLREGMSLLAFELRCATKDGKSVQDVLPPSVHPEILRPYQWGGLGTWENLPELPAEILKYWDSLIEQDEVSDSTPRHDNGEVNWPEVMKALTYINTDQTYDDWISVGMGLHSAGTACGDTEKAFKVWDAWSSLSTSKYPGDKSLRQHWKTFNADKGVTIGTVFQFAFDGGYHSPSIDVSSMFKPISEDTLEADPFSLFEPQVPELNMGWVPAPLRDRAIEMGIDKGCDPLLSVASGILAIAGAADVRSTLNLRGTFKVHPIIWAMVVGSVSDKKTPGSSPMFKVFDALEEEALSAYKLDYKKWKTEEARYAFDNKTHIASFKETKDGKPMTDEEREALVPDEIRPKPEPLRILVKDITSQKLSRMASKQERGLICHIEEMNSWFGRMSDDYGSDDRSTWVTAYDCEPLKVDRVVDGSWTCKHFGVSIYGNTQPKIFRKHFASMQSDGLLQRFLPFVVNPKAATLRDPIDELLSNGHVWEAVVRRVHATPEMHYELSEEAYKIFHDFEKQLDRMTKNERVLNTDDSILGLIGKSIGFTGRLALIFHLMESPTATTVEAHTMEMAIAFIRHYTIPAAKHLYGEIGGVTGDGYERYLGELLVHLCHEDTVTLRVIKKRSYGKFRELGVRSDEDKSRLIYQTMQSYEAIGWVVVMKESSKGATWAINPDLKRTFAKRKERIRVAKQESRDMMVSSLLHWKKVKSRSST